jgi:hypothetical protein
MLQYLLVTPTRQYAFFDTSIVSRSGKPTSAFTQLAAWASAAANAGKIAVAGRQNARVSTQSQPPPQSSGGGSSGGSSGGSGGGSGGAPPPPSCSVPELPVVGCPAPPT